MSTIAKVFPGFASVVYGCGFEAGRECVYGEHIPGGVRIEQTTEHDEIDSLGEQWVIDCYTLVSRDTLEEAWAEWQNRMEAITAGIKTSYNALGNGTRNENAAKVLSEMRERSV